MTDETAPRRPLRRVVLVAAAATAAVGLLGGTVAWATTRDATSPEIAPQTLAAGHDARVADEAADAASGRHRHEPLPPYDERYAAATEEEQQAADDLLADVRATLAGFADVDAAVAAGYLPPRRPHSARVHYLNPELARSGDVLDPAAPSGLVYFQPESGDAVLVGAFFVAPPDAAAPTPAGDLAVWHSHSRRCPDFYATPEAPCLDARRMLHVWTVDVATLRVVDPFGVPFKASVERVDA